MISQSLIIAFACLAATEAQARTLWSTKPADSGPRGSPNYILKSAYLLGNGRLGATPYGAPGSAGLMLNVDSLWSGGPFEGSNYTGGNPLEPKYQALPEIRSNIFQNGTGDLSPLLGSGQYYGSYRVLGNLTINVDGTAEDFTQYKRQLDLKTGLHTTSYQTSTGQNITETAFCSFPDQVCVYKVSASKEGSSVLPPVNIRFENILVDQTLVNITCGDGFARIQGLTQAGPPEGMRYDAIAQLQDANTGKTSCSEDGALAITPADGQREVTLVVSAGTNYDMKKGNRESNYSFKGPDPSSQVEQTVKLASAKSFDDLVTTHLQDFTRLSSAFELNLPDSDGSSEIETAALVEKYTAEGPGNPYLEATLFDLGRYLLISSSRSNSLPANLQGRWAEGIESAWGADYHANINIQMNYWAAEQTGLEETYEALFRYIEETWVPRGKETSKLLYGVDEEHEGAWVVHNEMNIFGHTAMKEEASWANYPAAAAWFMQHVANYYHYTQDKAWLSATGYPLIKGVAQFWLSQLQPDLYSNDGTLVVNPCNSPEHGPTTFGCAHYQQEIWHVFDAVLSLAPHLTAPERDTKFLEQVRDKLSKLDKGIHISPTWGGLKEWKLPDSYGLDGPSDHRHLSHLTGWFPGYSISSFANAYSPASSPSSLSGNTTTEEEALAIQAAVRQALISRGVGNAQDGNAGWAKVWRAACWSRLNDTEKAYFELRYAIQENFVGNGLSMYSGKEEPFQIDANFGFSGAVLGMLVVDLPVAWDRGEEEEMGRSVVLGPAIPERWGEGSVKGLRIRGGGRLDFAWDGKGVVTEATVSGSLTRVRLVNVKGELLAEA